MRVLYDGRIFEQQRAGGISRLFAEVIPQIDEEPDIRAVVMTTGRLRSLYDLAERVECAALPDSRSVLRPRRYFSRLHPRVNAWAKDIFSMTGYDVWHSTEYSVPRTRLPCVITLHDMIPEFMPDQLETSYRDRVVAEKRRAVKRADVIIAVSETTRNDVLGHYVDLDPDRIVVIPNGIDASVFAPRRAVREPVLLYVGRRDRYKGFDSLIAGLNAWDAMQDYRLLVVGTELSPSERKKCRFEVATVSNIPDTELADLYARAAALIFPSRYEGFGLPLLEAMATGCPIVATDIPSTREVADTVPYYFEVDDVRGLTAALTACCSSDPSSRRTEATEHLARYSWDRTASRTADVYRRIAG